MAGKEDIQVCLEEDKSENINSPKLSGSTEGSQDKTAEQGKEGNNTEVRLLKAVRLPGRHGKVVTGSTVKTLKSKELLLDPHLRNLDDKRVIVTEALVKVDQQNKVKVLVENHETFPVFLEAGTTLGFNLCKWLVLTNYQKHCILKRTLRMRVQDPKQQTQRNCVGDEN